MRRAFLSTLFSPHPNTRKTCTRCQALIMICCPCPHTVIRCHFGAARRAMLLWSPCANSPRMVHFFTSHDIPDFMMMYCSRRISRCCSSNWRDLRPISRRSLKFSRRAESTSVSQRFMPLPDPAITFAKPAPAFLAYEAEDMPCCCRYECYLQ